MPPILFPLLGIGHDDWLISGRSDQTEHPRSVKSFDSSTDRSRRRLPLARTDKEQVKKGASQNQRMLVLRSN